MTLKPDLITVLKVLGSHRESLRQRIWGPLEELDRLEAELRCAKIISGEKLKRIDELDKYESPEADQALYFAHPLCWLCEQLESRIGPSPTGALLERHDLEFAAYRLNTTLGLRPSHHVASKRPDLPDWRWLGPRFVDMDTRGVTAKLLCDLERLWPEICKDVHFGNVGEEENDEPPSHHELTKDVEALTAHDKSDKANEPTDVTEQATEQQQADVATKKQGLSNEEFNWHAGNYLKKHATDEHVVTNRELADHLKMLNPAGTCSTHTVHWLPVYRQYYDKLLLTGRRGKKKIPKAVSFTPELEATVSAEDAQLKRLTQEQADDYEPSPLDDDPPDEPPVKFQPKIRKQV